jgi:hypothetical protein
MSGSSSSSSNAYNYANNINTPSQLGMGEDGSFGQLGTDINALRAYVSVLISGESAANSTGEPLGNKYFLKTGAVCQATDSCSTDGSGNTTCSNTDRYIYINNVPSGNIPFISSAAGVDFTDFRGLIPGVLEDAGVLDPTAIFSAFTEPAVPPCQQITMETIDVNNNHSTETQYVTTSDISNMDPCIFNTSQYNSVNPVTGAACKESFKNGVANNAEVVMSDDPIDKLYFAGLACVGVYILYCIMKKGH